MGVANLLAKDVEVMNDLVGIRGLSLIAILASDHPPPIDEDQHRIKHKSAVILLLVVGLETRLDHIQQMVLLDPEKLPLRRIAPQLIGVSGENFGGVNLRVK